MEPCRYCQQSYPDHSPDCPVVAAMHCGTRSCPACGGSLRAIRILLGPPAAYCSIEAKPSWINGAYPVAGLVFAGCCDDCRGIQLFAVPSDRRAEELLPIPAEQGRPRPDDLPLPSGEAGET